MAQSFARARAAWSVDGTVWRTLAWIGVALQAVALVAVLWIEQWIGALSLGVFFVVSTVFMLVQDRMPSLISLMFIIAAMINAAGWAWGLFHRFVWYDEAVHGFTGFAGMAAVSYFAWSRGSFAPPGTAKFILKTAVWGLGLGILWEIVEFVFLDIGLVDTLVDLLMDTVGAAIGGWFTGWVIKERERTHSAPARS